VVLFHGMNFGGLYFSGPIEVLRKEGLRVVAPDQIVYFLGEPGGTRTRDPLIKSQMLYRLSYRPFAAWRGSMLSPG
jgi:hypothetical protein